MRCKGRGETQHKWHFLVERKVMDDVRTPCLRVAKETDEQGSICLLLGLGSFSMSTKSAIKIWARWKKWLWRFLHAYWLKGSASVRGCRAHLSNWTKGSMLQNKYEALCIVSFCHLEQKSTFNKLIYAIGSFVICMNDARETRSSLNMTVINIMCATGSSSLPFNMTPATSLTQFPTKSNSDVGFVLQTLTSHDL